MTVMKKKEVGEVEDRGVKDEQCRRVKIRIQNKIKRVIKDIKEIQRVLRRGEEVLRIG